MKICLVGKYPPIQGGVSAQNYWLARGLACLGHEVHCVTNANEVEPSYRMYLSPQDRLRLDYQLGSGGSVKLHATAEPPGLDHIPYANAFVTKLAALTADVVDEHACEVIYASYFEPYGLAGSLAARWTGTPFALKHAGSDLGRLAQESRRARAYRELIREAGLVFTGPSTVRTLLSAGVSLDRIDIGASPPWPSEFSPAGDALDIGALIEEVSATAFACPPRCRAFDPSLPTIGVFGKLGLVKGTPDLVHAISTLEGVPLEFNTVFLCGASAPATLELRSSLQRLRVRNPVVLLPFLAPWRVPEFLRACTAVCVLENRFPISIHRPGIALEVLSTGTCLIVSKEVATRQPQAVAFENRSNAFVVDDPRDQPHLVEALRCVITAPKLAAEIGRAGHRLFQRTAELTSTRPFSTTVQRLTALAQQRGETVSLQAFQAAVTRLYTSADFRESMRLGTAEPSLGDLTGSERKAIEELSAMRGELDSFALELQRKAFDFAWQHFVTVKRYFDDLRPSAFRFFTRRYDFSDRGWFGNIAHIGSILQSWAAEGAAKLPPGFNDVVRYDLATLRAETRPVPDDELGAFYGQPPMTRQRVDWVDVCRLCVNPVVEIVEFGHDVTALVSGSSPEELKMARCHLAFIPGSADRSTATVTLAAGVVQILECIGAGVSERTDITAAIATLHGVDPGDRQFAEACAGALRSLYELGVLVAAPEA